MQHLCVHKGVVATFLSSNHDHVAVPDCPVGVVWLGERQQHIVLRGVAEIKRVQLSITFHLQYVPSLTTRKNWHFIVMAPVFKIAIKEGV